MNLKVTDNRPAKKLVQGYDVLTVKPGTLLRFEEYVGPHPCINRPGELSMRVDSHEKPLVHLATGAIRGSNIENFIFEVLENTIVEININ